MGRADHLAQYQFKPGWEGGPGRPPSPLAEKEVRKYTREHVGDVMNKVMELSDKELETLLSDPDVPQFEKVVAKVMLTARTSGDVSNLDKLLDRIIGKVPQKIEGNPDAPIGFMVMRTPPERKKPDAPEELHI